MSERQRLMQDYLRASADRLGLRDWAISYKPHDKPRDPDSDAETAILYEQDAEVVIGEQFWELDPNEQRGLIAHELTHCLFATLANACDALVGSFEKPIQRRIAPLIEQAEEHSIEKVARLLAPLLALPPDFPKETDAAK